MDQLINFVRESNKIEGIIREPLTQEIQELQRFINLSVVTVDDLERFVSIYEPKAKLRTEYGLNVVIQGYYPPFSGPKIKEDLNDLLLKYTTQKDAFSLHVSYEMLHPFTDCNGRSGRALWAQRNKSLDLGFLHAFYYQTLSYMQQFFK